MYAKKACHQVKLSGFLHTQYLKNKANIGQAQKVLDIHCSLTYLNKTACEIWSVFLLSPSDKLSWAFVMIN